MIRYLLNCLSNTVIGPIIVGFFVRNFWFANHLLCHYRWSVKSFLIPLMSSNVKCQGRTVTDRYFVILSMRNIAHIPFVYNTRDDTSALTMFEANLVHGTTHTCLFKIPVGGKFKKETSDINGTNVASIKFLCNKAHIIFLLIIYEDITESFLYWAWFEHSIINMLISPMISVEM